MERLHRNEFWRVEEEYWDIDIDDQNTYLGTETFQRGSSKPYPSLQAAQAAALDSLRLGYWVQIKHYPSQFVEEPQDRRTNS